MQLFMLLYSGRNTVVHLCENYPVVSKRGHKFENEFFLKIWRAIFEVFRLAGAIHLTNINEIWQDEEDWRSP